MSGSTDTVTARAERSSASDRLRRWQAYLLEEVDGASLAAFRFLFGAILVWEVVRYVQYGRIPRYYIEPNVFFSYVSFLKPWGGTGMYWHFAAIAVLSALCALGLFYRAAMPLLCAAFTYVFLLDKSQYLNHFYLVCLLAFLLSLAPAHRAFSLDRLRALRKAKAEGRPAPSEGVPRWSLLILRAQVAIVYFYGGIAKLNADWLHGKPLDMWLRQRADMPVFGPLLEQPGTALFVAYAGLLIDLSMAFLLLSRRGLPVGAVICVIFNVSNAVIFSIGIFPWMMIGTLVLFADPGLPRRVLKLAPFTGGAAAVTAPGRAARVGLGLLHLYLLVHLLVPLRHWLYPGDVAWNEQGHRFSWRMKLRDKKVGQLEVVVLDRRNGVRERIDVNDWLTPRQVDEMATRPDMLVDFGHMVADRWEAASGVRPIVTARVTVSLNGGPYRELVDPRLDLASQPRDVLFSSR